MEASKTPARRESQRSAAGRLALPANQPSASGQGLPVTRTENGGPETRGRRACWGEELWKVTYVYTYMDTYVRTYVRTYIDRSIDR